MVNNKFKIKSSEKGQSLFELVVAIAISALMVVAMVSLAVNSIQNSNFSKNKARAATYAQQATEWLRGQRDNNIETFITEVEKATDPNERCFNSLPATISSLSLFPCASNESIDGTPFQRYVIFSFGNDSKTVITADVTVTWTDSGGAHEAASVTSFSDWRQR